MSASLILPGFFLGTREAANATVLDARGIHSVLSFCETTLDRERFNVLPMEIVDSPEEQIGGLFQKALSFLVERRLEGDAVLVHCSAGVSRSATFVIAYLLTVFNWNVEDTIKYVEHCRDIINPNDGFLQQLQAYHDEQRDAVREYLEESYGKDFTMMVEKDLESVEEIKSGEECSVMVVYKGKNTFIKMHSSLEVDFAARVSTALLDVEGECDFFLSSEEEELADRNTRIDGLGIDVHSIMFEWKANA